MKTFADNVINFNQHLVFTGGQLPSGIRILNPFQESAQALSIAERFYHQYYQDTNKRHIIMGINPGRFGGGLTGIPFTDPKRLEKECGIHYEGKSAHELSSVFVYDVINAYGGVKAFYEKFYISSVCPLGFTTLDAKGKEKNYNYYDSKELTQAAYPFIVESMQKQIDLGVYTDIAFCFGNGKNDFFLRKLNAEHHFFKRIIALEHPRFIMQYKLSTKQFYIDKYLDAFRSVL
ncbi:SMUG2 DNA glycosylase family protein [Mucilaginibacter robiniae]|uniref:SMUG2 DNA glycosylase family protein n=1 Tax=Mucilaginibacter robiniae TaxID=2728022 RepID=A0A7L5DX61_9SPHI|nr:uracil-DNA glycosylase family protein [Mucilaginibacter robiniae]QJD95341.1 SMUG2 DNA glycosylase family protein [Mucilaginibacter robiniae]